MTEGSYKYWQAYLKEQDQMQKNKMESLKSRIERFTNHIHAIDSADLVERFNKQMKGTGYYLVNIPPFEIQEFRIDARTGALSAHAVDKRGSDQD